MASLRATSMAFRASSVALRPQHFRSVVMRYSRPNNFARSNPIVLSNIRFFSDTSKDPEQSDQVDKKEETMEGEIPEQNAAADATDGTEAAEGGEVDPMEEMTQKVAQLEQEIHDHKEHHLRILAEMENMRKRHQRELESEKKYAVQKVCKSLLSVIDNLGWALQSVPEESDNKELKALYEGVQLTEKDLLHQLASAGVAKIESKGMKFDPQLHEAMFEYPDPSAEPGSVGQVIKEGYTLHDRVLRAAQVGVVKAE